MRRKAKVIIKNYIIVTDEEKRFHDSAAEVDMKRTLHNLDMINPILANIQRRRIYCTKCGNLKLDGKSKLYCPFDSKCDIWDFGDRRAYKRRPVLK